MTRARDLANIADGTFTATDLDLSGTLTVSGDANFDSGSLFVDVSANAVGIGTTSPSFTAGNKGIHIADATSPAIRLQDTNNANSDFTIYSPDGENALRIYHQNSATDFVSITSAGNVGIGTTSPARQLQVGTGGTAASNVHSLMRIEGATRAGGLNGATLEFVHITNAPATLISSIGTITEGGRSDTAMQFTLNSTERMRLDHDGNLLVGKTASDTSSAGHELRSGSFAAHTVDGDVALNLRRLTSNGDIARFQKDGNTSGTIGVYSDNYLYIGSPGGTDTHIAFVNGSVRPSTNDGSLLDNVLDLGNASARWDDVFATNGTIQTSDANEKQDIAELDEAERRVAVAAKGLLRKFRWIDSVEAKGDDARIHFGIIAQDLQAAFEAEGLDAGRYAMFIHSTWTDEETGEERSRMGVRYSELLAFIIAAL